MKTSIYIFFFLLSNLIIWAQTSPSSLSPQQSTVNESINPTNTTQKTTVERGNDASNFEQLFLQTNQYFHQQKHLKALLSGNQALAIAEKEKNIKNQIKINGLLGNIYESVSMYHKTREHVNKAEELIASGPLPEDMRYIEGNVYYLKAMNFAHTLDLEMALGYFDKAIAIFSSTHHSFSGINLQLSYLNKGFAYLELNKLEEATILFEKMKEKRIEESTTNLPPSVLLNLDLFILFAEAKKNTIQNKPTQSIGILNHISTLDKETLLLSNQEDFYLLYVRNFLNLHQIDSVKKYNALYNQEVAKGQLKQQDIFQSIIATESKKQQEIIVKLKSKNTVLLLFSSLIFIGGLLLSYFLYFRKKIT